MGKRHRRRGVELTRFIAVTGRERERERISQMAKFFWVDNRQPAITDYSSREGIIMDRLLVISHYNHLVFMY